jgi:predicted component of type VI protein secretion system
MIFITEAQYRQLAVNTMQVDQGQFVKSKDWVWLSATPRSEFSLMYLHPKNRTLARAARFNRRTRKTRYTWHNVLPVSNKIIVGVLRLFLPHL